MYILPSHEVDPLRVCSLEVEAWWMLAGVTANLCFEPRCHDVAWEQRREAAINYGRMCLVLEGHSSLPEVFEATYLEGLVGHGIDDEQARRFVDTFPDEPLYIATHANRLADDSLSDFKIMKETLRFTGIKLSAGHFFKRA